jgi:hypothetical protein
MDLYLSLESYDNFELESGIGALKVFRLRSPLQLEVFLFLGKVSLILRMAFMLLICPFKDDFRVLRYFFAIIIFIVVWVYSSLFYFY